MGTNWGAVAGGVVDGMEIAERRRLNRNRDARETERHQFDMGERYRQAEGRDRQEAAWDELNAAIARRLQRQAPTQPAAPQQPTAGAIEQGNGVQTMPFQDDGAGLQARALPDTEGAAPGFMPVQSPAAAPGGLVRAPEQPTQAASPAPTAGQGDDPGKKIGFSLYQNPNLLRDPDFLNEAAGIFMRARMPEGVKWLERGFAAQQENGIDAMKAFIAGDAQRGIQAFNSSGREKISGAQPITEGEHKGKWALQFEGAPQPIVIDPAGMLRSFLDPKAYFDSLAKDQEGKRKDAESAATVDERKARTRYYDSQSKAVTDNAASLADYRSRMGGAAETRANNPRGAGTGANTDRQRAQLSNQIDAQLRRQMRDTAPVDTLGKKQTNPLSEFVPDIREAVIKDVDAGVDPNLAFNNRYVEWGEKFDQANEVLGQAFDKAKRAGSGLLKGREDSVKSLRESIAELEKQGISVEEQRRFAKAAKKDMQLFNEAAQGMASGRVSRPGAPAAAAPASGGAPKTPKTRAEVEAYPPGTPFINPANGQLLYKK